MKKNAIVIGSGFAGLSAACRLAQAGQSVVVLEKNSSPGGRARSFSAQGFHFDMGPSWYWMPDIFDSFFARFGRKTSDYYELVRLSPSYQVFFEDNHTLQTPADMGALERLFEQYEPGGGAKLRAFLADATFKYQFSMGDFIYKPCHSPLEFADFRIARAARNLQLFNSLSEEIRKYFSDSRLIRLLEFPSLFLGAKPEKTPAMYSLMNYADMCLGTWYPMGGMSKIVDAMVSLAESLGVRFVYNAAAESIQVQSGRAVSVTTQDGAVYPADHIVAAADYQHVEQHLLETRYRQYDAKYWESRVMAPSSLLFYLGVEGRVDNLLHHNLFFDKDFSRHAEAIYDHPEWPEAPLFYACAPSVTDPSVAPPGCENIFLLMPISADITESPEIIDHYYNLMMERLEARAGQSIRDRVVFKRSYCGSDFKQDYNAWKGNAYGLANTLLQTAFMKPKIKSSKVKNLYYAGQLTVPGPGMPPAIISGQIAANEILKIA